MAPCECGNEPSGPEKAGIFLSSERLSASKESLFSMELVVTCVLNSVVVCDVVIRVVFRYSVTAHAYSRLLSLQLAYLREAFTALHEAKQNSSDECYCKESINMDSL